MNIFKLTLILTSLSSFAQERIYIGSQNALESKHNGKERLSFRKAKGSERVVVFVKTVEHSAMHDQAPQTVYIPWEGVLLPSNFSLRSVVKKKIKKRVTNEDQNNQSTDDIVYSKKKKKVTQLIYTTNTGEEILCGESEGVRSKRMIYMKGPCRFSIEEEIDQDKLNRKRRKDKENVKLHHTTHHYYLEVNI